MRAERRPTAIELLQKLLPFEQQEIRPFVRHLCNLHELSRLECLTPLKAAQTAAVRDLRPAVAQTDLVLVLTASATKSGAALGSEVVYGRDYLGIDLMVVWAGDPGAHVAQELRTALQSSADRCSWTSVNGSARRRTKTPAKFEPQIANAVAKNRKSEGRHVLGTEPWRPQ
jgi:hypothetical protein